MTASDWPWYFLGLALTVLVQGLNAWIAARTTRNLQDRVSELEWQISELHQDQQ